MIIIYTLVLQNYLSGCLRMIICICNRVSDRDIARQARAGLDFEEIRFELGVAGQCGKCEGCARDIYEQCAGTVAHCNIEATLS